MRAALALAALVVAVLGCAGQGETDMGDSRLETARRLAQSPVVEGIPPFLSPYDPALGEGGAVTTTLAGRPVRRVRLDGDLRIGPVTVDHAMVGYGSIERRPSRLGPEALTPEHVLQDVFVTTSGASCEQIAQHLERVLGPLGPSGNWDGIITAAAFQWQGTGAEGRGCALWWSHWPPDMATVAQYHGDAPPPAEEPPSIAPDQRLAYLRAWHEGARRVLTGAEPAIDDTALDEAHQALLRRQLAALGE